MGQEQAAEEQAAEVVIVSLGSTAGLRRSDDELADSLRRAGASVAVARARPPRQTRTMMLTDLAWARACRDAAARMFEQQRRAPARAVIYTTTTAALLWPRPGAIRFDAPAASNRPGRHGVWQRPLELRRLRGAPLLLPCSEGAMSETPPSVRHRNGVLVVPIAVQPSQAPEHADGAFGADGEETATGSAPVPPRRDIAAITYAANPSKKGLDRVLAAWRRVLADRGSQATDELVVAGVAERELRQARLLLPAEPGVRVVGALAAKDYRALLRRARVFVCAPRREDYGLAQLEALADGCQLVSTPAPGPYVALPIARELDPRLVGEDLDAGLRAALDDPLADYAARARAALAPFSRDAVDRLVAQELLPRLLA
jgi:glycosyltransferase involved in cell wall biosynthesis